MSTYMPKASEIERKWYVLDAAGKPLGRVAATAATLLRGKHKVTFAPHADCGDHVVVINVAKAVMTGNKAHDKMYYHYSGFIGGMKSFNYTQLMQKDPCRAMMLAIKGMLPHNSLGAKELTRVRLYAGADHQQQAQAPEAWEL